MELCKEITVVGVPELKCKALIDSGTSKSLVKRSITEKYYLCVIVCHEKLIGFAGGETFATGKHQRILDLMIFYVLSSC